eukprot:SRR837773.22052.p1 GENE.SRR837773.22052~~SRR837773.22052.p1  ORF type:complete len:217 (+),score=13.73 SRR837773.22052:34-651(+)
MKEACAWAAQQPGLDVLLLFGHWDVPGLGAPTDMAMPAWYSRMASTPGCDAFDKRGMLKFVMGHTHCNDVHPHGKVDTGFRVAGFGMSGCGNYGMPIVDTTEGRVRFWYFDTTSADALKKVVACVSKSGWRQCTALATKWLDQPIVKRDGGACSLSFDLSLSGAADFAQYFASSSFSSCWSRGLRACEFNPASGTRSLVDACSTP